jgi:hypothetical protein
MLVARGRVEYRQAILRIGIQPLVPAATDVSPAQPSLQIPVTEYRALIDTGAQRTCLTHSTIAAEGLRRHGKKPIQNVHSVNIHHLYWVRMGFWCEDAAGLYRTYFALPDPVEVIDIASNDGFDAIIGMDVLGRGDLRIDRTGDFELRLG